MNREIVIFDNKTLILKNVVSLIIEDNADSNFHREIELMKQYIKTKGAKEVGPLIQSIEVEIKKSRDVMPQICFYRQINKTIFGVEYPYKFENERLIKNCIYARFNGPKKYMNLAYDKIKVFAFENDIQLMGTSYIIILQNNEDDFKMDVFVEKMEKRV